MSESEKKRRLDYKKNRKKWLFIQVVAIVLVSVLTVGSFAVYYKLNETYYIEYTENGDVGYKVYLKENSFYDEEWVGEGQAYVASLIDKIAADFTYELNMGANNVAYDYSYSVNAQLFVKDKKSGISLYDPTYEIVPKKTVQSSGSKLNIRENVEIDYEQYNAIASEFTSLYELKNSDSSLVVTLEVVVISHCESFESSNNNTYSVSMIIPLLAADNTVNIHKTSSVPTSESKVLAYGSAINKDVFKIIGIVAACLDFVLVCAILAFAYLTRNEDIRYEARVKKILSSYRAFIQVITNEFDTTGYRILNVGTFNEMLGVRDTIQSPILMSENKDKTCTRFLITTNTDILYVFEIKVENYDEIYGNHDVEHNAEFVIDEFDEELTEISEEELEEALATPDVVLEDIDYEEDDDEDNEGTEDEPGVEVVGVVWPEHKKKNKVYRYDPNGESLETGDVVLVPSHDAASDKDIIRKAAVAHRNHKVAPQKVHHPLKKIIGIVRRKAEQALTPEDKD